MILTGDELDVRPGEWLLQTAAGSTVGQSVIQLGAHVGFRTLNVVRRRSAVEDILALGIPAVICTEDEDLCERVADIAGHDGVFKAIDCVSGQVGADVSRALAAGGELVVYGALSTHRQTDPDKLTVPIFARSLLPNKDCSGVLAVSLVHREPEGSDGRSDRPDSSARRQRRVARAGGPSIPVEKFSNAVYLAEATAQGGKPLLVFDRSGQICPTTRADGRRKGPIPCLRMRNTLQHIRIAEGFA